MTVLDFCKHRQVQAQTVMQYIRRNPDKFDGHTTKNGQSWELDEVAIKLLENKYPMPAEVMAPLDAELVQQLEAQKDLIIELQQKIIIQAELIATAQANQLLLTERTSQLEELKSEKTDLTAENLSLQARIVELRDNARTYQALAEETRKELEAYKNRPFWKRVFNV